MDEYTNKQYITEASLMIQEKTIIRQWITIMVLIFLLVASNVAWIWYESQFSKEETTQEITQELDTDDGDAIINDGVHINGEGETNSKNNN